MDTYILQDRQLIDRANLVIDEALEMAGGPPASRSDAERWVATKRTYESHPALLELCHSFCRDHGYAQPHHCQIALRFPGERVGEDTLLSRWHLDKNRFDRLLGIYLNDNLEGNCGNFVVALGSETLHRKENVEPAGLEGTFEEIGISPSQVLAAKGTLLSVDRLLCHSVAANQSRDYIRRVVWFRLRKKL